MQRHPIPSRFPILSSWCIMRLDMLLLLCRCRCRATPAPSGDLVIKYVCSAEVSNCGRRHTRRLQAQVQPWPGEVQFRGKYLIKFVLGSCRRFFSLNNSVDGRAEQPCYIDWSPQNWLLDVNPSRPHLFIKKIRWFGPGRLEFSDRISNLNLN
jgi:hypothetical protein